MAASPDAPPFRMASRAIDAEKAPRLLTAVTGGTGTFQERLDLSREIDLPLILRRSNRERPVRDGGLARCGPDRQGLRQAPGPPSSSPPPRSTNRGGAGSRSSSSAGRGSARRATCQVPSSPWLSSRKRSPRATPGRSGGPSRIARGRRGPVPSRRHRSRAWAIGPSRRPFVALAGAIRPGRSVISADSPAQCRPSS